MEELRLPDKVRRNILEFVQAIKNVYLLELISVVLYGSTASGEFSEATSDINLLVILKNVQIPQLIRAIPIINRLQFRRIHALFITEEQITKNAHCFPIEFLDMKENYSVIDGKDVLRDINIDTRNLKFQCEQELRSKLINLRQQYIKTEQRDKFALRNLLFSNFSSVLHILRNLVRLQGKAPSYHKEDVLREGAIEFQLVVTNLLKILSAKRSPEAVSVEDAQAMVINLEIDLMRLIAVSESL